MKKKFLYISILLIGYVINGNTQTPFIIFNNQTIDCAELSTALETNKVVCLVKNNPIAGLFKVNLNNCKLEVDEDEQLLIPSLIDINLIDSSSITLKENGALTGEHFQTSRVVIGSGGLSPAVNIDDSCEGCSVSEITITADDTVAGVTTGLEIGENSKENELTAVKFDALDNGMVVKGDENIFNDLQFFEVAIDSDDSGNCEPTSSDPFAIKLVTSSLNTFTNVLHTRSPGAITMYINAQCNNNTILNMSVEQERSKNYTGCAGPDPALYFDNTESINNIITCNFNGAYTDTPDDVLICSFNNISDLGCNNVIIGIDCAGN